MQAFNLLSTLFIFCLLKFIVDPLKHADVIVKPPLPPEMAEEMRFSSFVVLHSGELCNTLTHSKNMLNIIATYFF